MSLYIHVDVYIHVHVHVHVYAYIVLEGNHTCIHVMCISSYMYMYVRMYIYLLEVTRYPHVWENLFPEVYAPMLAIVLLMNHK